MRVIGGTLKGRRFSPPRQFKGRPTTDFGREGLFNLLRSRLELDGIEALDLFAGSGAVSFELASRGKKASNSKGVKKGVKRPLRRLDAVKLNTLSKEFTRRLDSHKLSVVRLDITTAIAGIR